MVKEIQINESELDIKHSINSDNTLDFEGDVPKELLTIDKADENAYKGLEPQISPIKHRRKNKHNKSGSKGINYGQQYFFDRKQNTSIFSMN